MATHLLREEEVEESLVGVPMSQICCSHMESVLAPKADLKASKTVQVWPRHFQRFCPFQMAMMGADLQVVWGKDEKQVKKLIEKDAKRKASMAASVLQVHLAEEAIKNGTVVESLTLPCSLPRKTWSSASSTWSLKGP